ncbi:MAG: hypothetical protein IPM08_08015 [Actinomycetales bacterium]|nr:hypothetical protein [Actinomycetales bacterium]
MFKLPSIQIFGSTLSAGTSNVRSSDEEVKAMTEGLRLSVGGDHAAVAAEAVHEAMGAAIALLSEAASQLDVATGTWTLDELTLGSATMVLLNPSAIGAVALVADGIEELRRTPRIPSRWTPRMVRRALKLGELVGRRGVTCVSLGRASDQLRSLDGQVTAHAGAALAPKETAIGTVVGTVDMWQSRRGRTLGLTLDSGETVRALYPADLTEKVLREAVGHRVMISGEIQRNGAGQRVSITILDVERAERPLPMDIAALAGLYADVAAAGVTVADILEHRE